MFKFALCEANTYKPAQMFFQRLFRETIKCFENHYTAIKNIKEINGQYPEYGFEVNEQQAKTFLTIALGKITNCSCMQEYQIDRKIDRKRAGSAESPGRVDYYAHYNYGNSTFLIEVKHGFIKYYPKGKGNRIIKIYDVTKNRFDYGYKQLIEIKNKEKLKYKNNFFMINLLIAAIFYTTDKNNNRREMKRNLFQKIKKQCFNEMPNANGFAFAAIKEKELYSFKPQSKSSPCEFYPGVLFIANIEKINL